jgi:hypothetical protein
MRQFSSPSEVDGSDAPAQIRCGEGVPGGGARMRGFSLSGGASWAVWSGARGSARGGFKGVGVSGFLRWQRGGKWGEEQGPARRVPGGRQGGGWRPARHAAGGGGRRSTQHGGREQGKKGGSGWGWTSCLGSTR